MTGHRPYSDRADVEAVLLRIGQEIRAWEAGACTRAEAQSRIGELVRHGKGLLAARSSQAPGRPFGGVTPP